MRPCDLNSAPQAELLEPATKYRRLTRSGNSSCRKLDAVTSIEQRRVSLDGPLLRRRRSIRSDVSALPWSAFPRARASRNPVAAAEIIRQICLSCQHDFGPVACIHFLHQGSHIMLNSLFAKGKTMGYFFIRITAHQ